MIAVDTNILVYAHRPENAFHRRAKDIVTALAEGNEGWAVPWPCMHEFLALVTHPKVFKEPTTVADALMQAAAWMASPSVRIVGETDAYFPILHSILTRGSVTGPKVHDARILAICIANGISRLYSADRDFSRFASPIRVENPL